MPYTTLQAQKPTDLVDLLNGAIFSEKDIQTVRQDGPKGVMPPEEVFLALNGLTLEFTTPVVTITFATANPVPLSSALSELNTQLQAADPAALVSIVNSQSAPGTLNPPGKRFKFFTDAAAGLVMDLDPGTSTAAELLGFSRSAGKTVSGIPVDPNNVVSGGDTISGGHYIIVHT